MSESKGKTEEESKKQTGPQKGDFLPPPELEDKDEAADALPAQEEF